ncbi:rhodanese-like domain-containing protein [Paenibacillus elgii]|uniref:rhodanese-like domain-containing protein n=1 Tax=Paenibacillus elgii TaxID=189691 RepID=UPI0020425F48|nr:rhodanese-like domain-containing protein [Paenibacillus elgii]MCM3271950.1 rhodanese-like domain-containing protein [Paenibacillus elgii]
MSYTMVINVLLVAVAVWFVYSRLAPAKGLRTLTPQEFDEELKQNRHSVLIDVREPHEVKQGYIAGAKNIPLSKIKKRLNEIPADKKIYLYCRSGVRSRQAASILRKNGFRELAQLQGGIMSWRGARHIPPRTG